MTTPVATKEERLAIAAGIHRDAVARVKATFAKAQHKYKRDLNAVERGFEDRVRSIESEPSEGT